MMGNLDRTDWDVEWKKGLKIWYLPQEFNLHEENSVLDEVFQTDHTSAELIKKYEELMYTGDAEELTELIPLLDEYWVWSYQAKVDTIIARLWLQKLLHQKISTLSWGEKKKSSVSKNINWWTWYVGVRWADKPSWFRNDWVARKLFKNRK
jgi:ATPase subunit of ABC transporter with duplicated ATPase domains